MYSIYLFTCAFIFYSVNKYTQPFKNRQATQIRQMSLINIRDKCLNFIYFLNNLACAIYNYITGNDKIVRKFDEKIDYVFYLEKIEFYKDNKLVKAKIYNQSFDNKKTLEFNIDVLYDYYLVTYKHNENTYDFLSNGDTLTFPFYDESEIKNYVYINKIIRAILKIEDFSIDIVQSLKRFVGPNYNFYKDIDCKIITKDIIKYIMIKHPNIKHLTHKIDNNEFKLTLFDNFQNEYNIQEYLIWNPNLQL